MIAGTDTPLVSIGVPSYNRPQLLDRLLSQLLAQTYPRIEIIVSDNCSSAPEVFRVAQACSERDSRVRAFRQAENVGALANHDFVRSHARGKYFLWAHDDDEFPPNYIDVCVRYLEANASAVLVGPSCDRYLNGEYWLSYENCSTLGRSKYERLRELMSDAYPCHWRFEHYLSGLYVTEAAPPVMSKEFKTQFHHFFFLSDKGPFLHARELKIIKHTTEENLKVYVRNAHKDQVDTYRRHRVLRHFSQPMQECIPITLQMLDILWRSENLSVVEKARLTAHCVWLFIQHPLRDEIRARPLLARALNLPRRLFRKIVGGSGEPQPPV